MSAPVPFPTSSSRTLPFEGGSSRFRLSPTCRQRAALTLAACSCSSGSTVPYVVERLCQPPHNNSNSDRWCAASSLPCALCSRTQRSLPSTFTRRYIPTGFQSKELIVKAGLNLGDVDQFPTIDVTIDGADEVDVRLVSSRLARRTFTDPSLTLPPQPLRTNSTPSSASHSLPVSPHPPATELTPRLARAQGRRRMPAAGKSPRRGRDALHHRRRLAQGLQGPRSHVEAGRAH